MRLSKIIVLKGILAVSLIAISVTGFYVAAAPYLDPQFHCLRRSMSGVWGRRGDTDSSSGSEVSIDHLLPVRWQAEWKSGVLCVSHNNPDGTLADIQFFDNIECFYDWVDAHPDFCDLDVDKMAMSAIKASSDE